jgi:ribosomal protein L40E
MTDGALMLVFARFSHLLLSHYPSRKSDEVHLLISVSYPLSRMNANYHHPLSSMQCPKCHMRYPMSVDECTKCGTMLNLQEYQD